MLDSKIFISKFFSVNALAARSISSGKIALREYKEV